PLGAQSAPPVSTGHAVASARATWAQLTGYITMAAEQMPEKKYAFRPSPKVRTFGQLIGHVAGAQHMICASALGEPQQSEDNIEKNVTTKAGLIAALKSSTEYCNRAYAQTDAQAGAETTIFGQKQPRIYSLIVNASHNGEHYGNLVTYLRINDMVPPSSQPAPPRQ
ncbi:MAG: DinB family protein, partial [Gemmatimonadaceae bacterium]|nr:DinB family protein [Gemmatimonadaceae bacterium]